MVAGGAAVGVRCVSFAAPPVGNAALATTVRRRGWEPFFRTLLTPHDVVPHLLSLPVLWAAAPAPARSAAASTCVRLLLPPQPAARCP